MLASESKVSLFEFVSLPADFGTAMLLMALILTLSPFLAGHDFGILKIPDFRDGVRRKLRFLGPLLLALVVLLHVPVLPSGAHDPAGSSGPARWRIDESFTAEGFDVPWSKQYVLDTDAEVIVTANVRKGVYNPLAGQGGWARVAGVAVDIEIDGEKCATAERSIEGPIVHGGVFADVSATCEETISAGRRAVTVNVWRLGSCDPSTGDCAKETLAIHVYGQPAPNARR